MSVQSSTQSTRPEQNLRANTIGLPGVLFQSITTMAPAPAVAFTLGPAVAFTGGALPLAALIALIVCALIALNIGAMAKHLLTYFGIKISADTGVVLGCIEIAVFVLLSIWLIINAGSHNTLAIFNPTTAPSGVISATFLVGRPCASPRQNSGARLDYPPNVFDIIFSRCL